MDVALLVVRAALAAVFAAAALGKLADRPGSRRAAHEFGVPAKLTGVVALGLPLAELAVAALLLPPATAVWASLGAIALLTMFCVGIGLSLARGRTPDCHCFGQLHSEPAGPSTLLRNLVLAGAAAFVVAAGWSDPGTSAVGWLQRLHGSSIAAAVAVGVAAAALLAGAYLFEANRKLTLRVARLEGGAPEHGLPLGEAAPPFSLRDVSGEKRTLAGLLEAERPLLLVFTDPECQACDEVLPDVALWQRERGGELTVAVVSAGRPADTRAKAEEHGLGLVLADQRKKAFRAYDGAGTPCAVLVGARGRIDSPVVSGPRAIHGLVEERLGIATPGGLPVGSELPELTLSDLNGSEVDLRSFRGRETLFLFWSSSSDECRAMHPDLLAWEAERNDDVALVLISRSDAERLREEGFESPVLLDEAGDASYAFSGYETPAAVLVGQDGRVAWPLAAGPEHILRLLRSSSAVTAPV